MERFSMNTEAPARPAPSKPKGRQTLTIDRVSLRSDAAAVPKTILLDMGEESRWQGFKSNGCR
jgi:hypothetical protein